MTLEILVFLLVISGVGHSLSGNVWIGQARILPLRGSRVCKGGLVRLIVRAKNII